MADSLLALLSDSLSSPPPYETSVQVTVRSGLVGDFD